jgi:hypothetical protein
MHDGYISEKLPEISPNRAKAPHIRQTTLRNALQNAWRVGRLFVDVFAGDGNANFLMSLGGRGQYSQNSRRFSKFKTRKI